MPEMSEEEIRLLLRTMEQLSRATDRMSLVMDRVDTRLADGHDFMVQMRADVDGLLQDRKDGVDTRRGLLIAGFTLLGAAVDGLAHYLMGLLSGKHHP